MVIGQLALLAGLALGCGPVVADEAPDAPKVGTDPSGKTVLFSSHELETVERVCSRVVILHKGKAVANDSVEHLRGLMELPTLEAIFTQLALRQDPDEMAQRLAEAMRQ